MSKPNPLVGLIGYGDSDLSDDEMPTQTTAQPQPSVPMQASASVHPPPIPHCAWSACYDESSGFTYYWNQHTNEVTWEAPQEYLMALKLAQHQLHTAGSAEVSAEEWQLYQQALAEKKSQGKSKSKGKPKPDKPGLKNGAKRKTGSDDEIEKIELITSYHNSDSESNDEDTPVKPPVKSSQTKPLAPKNPHKKQKTKPTVDGPSLSQNYTVPIGPELPPGMVVEETLPPLPPPDDEKKEETTTPKTDIDDEEKELFKKLKDKAKLLEKLGGEIPAELKNMIQEEPKVSSPKLIDETSRDSKVDNIDDLLEEIEKKELPKVKSKKIDIFGEELSNSGKSTPVASPPREVKALFPSAKAIEETPVPTVSVENGLDKPGTPEKKPANLYLADSEVKENRKKLRIDHSLLPDRKKSEVPSYTTKYSQFIEGFSSERTGLGFKEDDDSPKVESTINYGNGLTFTKGEVLNEDKRDEDLDDMSELVEAKLKFLNEVQPCPVAPVQEMLIQWQTLVTAFRGGALAATYWRRWVRAGAAALRAREARAAPPGWSCSFQRYSPPHTRYWRRWVRAGAAALRAREARAAPPGWSCSFQRSEGRYRYRRESDGLTQWEYPAAAHMDMEICTTPPPEEPKVPELPPPLPVAPPLPAAPLPPAPPAAARPAPPPPPPPPPAPPARPATPPPPAWHDPPPPGCDDLPPLPPEPKKEIGDELLSFYSDIAELEQIATPPPPPSCSASAPPTTSCSPEPPPPPPPTPKEKDKDTKTSKKKSKVKISSSIGLKHKTVSSMVAKWQQVADEIHSD